ncbi:MAG: Clp protease ClpP, partial [Actinomycetota bacterium]
MIGIRELLPPSLLAHHRAPANRDRGAWYSVRNADGDDRAVVDLYDVIGEWGVTASEFVHELRGIDASVIELHINSPGGLIYDGLTIYNGLLDHPARVEAIVDGVAASAASWVLQAGDTRTMNRHTELMIHDGLA